MPRRSRSTVSRSTSTDSAFNRGTSGQSSDLFNATSLAVLGGVFVLGIGIGIAFSSSANLSPQNVATREVIDRAAPNATLCAQFGASAIAVDMRMFVTLNPFNAYVAQPTMQPGCVLRSNNWSILEQRDVVSSEDVNQCKNRMNTFGYVGALESDPDIECIYQNDSAKNLFLTPGVDGVLPESEKF